MNPNKYQALLLGSDPKLADAVSLVVRQDGGNIGIGATLADVMRSLQSYPPDLILLDLKTAEADALNLLRQIKSQPPTTPVFTIGFAPAPDVNLALRAFDLGLNEFIPVPFDSNHSLLRARLRAAVMLKRRLEDATSRHQELVEACRAAEANSRAKSDFLAAMSHEIRTPMNGVIAMTGLMMESPLTPDQRSYLDTIHSSSESLLKIINDILDFSKIEAGKMELERRPFDLRICIEESLDLLASRTMDKPVDLGYEVNERIPALIEGDAQRLRQVLVNLLGNAIKFTERGDVFVKVQKLLPAGGENEGGLKLHFAVHDSGIGIPPDRLAKLFKPFSQADVSTARKYGGTGLGLAISRRLVELMGGKMWAESVPGDGSTFHFTMQVTVPEDSKPPAHVAKMPRLADLKILILDDNGVSRNALFDQCRLWGMLPQAVENASQAMELIRQGTEFDLALIDLHLAGKDGLAVASEIQKLPNAAMLPMVLLTPLGKKKSSSEEVRIVFAHAVHKPVKPAQLCAALERALLSPRVPTRPPEPARATSQLAEKLPMRILVADDNAINQKVAVRILQQLGYTPELAANGREVLAAVDRAQFDFVFMDVMMPEMDGLEATRVLRKRQMAGDHSNLQPRIIICAMTAHAMAGDREKCLAAGMDDYLAKPVRPKDVRDMLERWGGKIIPNAGLPAAPVETKPTPTEPAVDMDRMNDLTDGNDDSLRELVDMYLKQTHKQFGQMQTAIRENNSDSLRRVAHSCAGASATLGMTRLVPKLRELEKMGNSGTLNGVTEVYDEALREYGDIQEFLKNNPQLTAIVHNNIPA
jgi:signal transduction histidine kinase/DNA-binding LytR/AlgR family response regulator/HPt (histidine-containing phosphotransfer) domain-containing protein